MNKFTKLMTSATTAVLATVAVPVSAFAQLTYDYTYSNELTDEEAGGLLAGLGLCYCLGGLVWLIVEIALVVWVYKDAKKRNNNNAVLWAVLVFFFNLLALVIYLLTQRKDSVAPASQAQAEVKEPVQESPVTPTEETK